VFIRLSLNFIKFCWLSLIVIDFHVAYDADCEYDDDYDCDEDDSDADEDAGYE
jgi:hypothetical protein